jgi:serine protease DegS
MTRITIFRTLLSLLLLLSVGLTNGQSWVSESNGSPDKTLLESVVAVFIQNDLTKEREGAGSAYLHDGQGHLITMANVPWRERRIGTSLHVLLPNGSTRPVSFLIDDERTRIAVLKMEPDTSIRPVMIGQDRELLIGLPVTQLGRQADGKTLSQQGKLLAFFHAHDSSKHSGLGSFSASINMRNSTFAGAPLVLGNGSVGGISVIYDHNATLQNPVAYFMTARVVSELADELIKKGRISRGTIGITMDLMQNGAVTELVVLDLAAGKPAAMAGFQINDVLVKINGSNIASADQVRTIVSASKPGAATEFEVKRAGKVLSLKVVASFPN